MQYPLWFQVRVVKAFKGTYDQRFENHFIETVRTDSPVTMALKIVSGLDAINRIIRGCFQ